MFARPFVTAAMLVAAAGASAQMGTSFTYQGRLTENGQLPTGVYDMSFRLYTSSNALFPIGDAWAVEDVQVTGGLFTTTVDFGTHFTGDDRWISVSVRPGSQTGAYTVLSPRQQVTASPYALTARSIAVPMTRSGATSPDLFGPQALIHLIQGGSSDSIRGETSGTGVGVHGLHTGNTGIVSGVFGESVSPSGRGVWGHATTPSGSQAFGVYGVSNSGTSGASGVRGVAAGGGDQFIYGVFGQSTTSTEGIGVHGQGRYGVYGLGTQGGIEAKGVLGVTSQTDGVGVHGRATGGGGSSTGIWGEALGSAAWAGFFSGDVRVAGLLWANEKDFLIDNPANPNNEFLIHACIESDERRNLYDGVVTLDPRGAATIQLPNWFDKLNANFRYQLTCIGGSAPVYIAREVQNNQFVIAGGAPGMRVSWQVTGVRIDPDARSRPFQAVRAKDAEDRGRFVNPRAYGLSESASIGRMPNPYATERAPVAMTGDEKKARAAADPK